MDLYPLFVAVPLGVAFLAALVPKRARRLADALGLVGALALAALAVLFFGRAGVVHVGGWAPPVGIMMVLDPLSWLMLAVIAGVTLAVTVYSVSYMERYTAKGRYYALFFLMVAGMAGVVATGDLFNMYVFLEIAAISSYALVAFGCEAEELEASFKYAVLGSVASSFILLGLAITYSLFGTVNMAHLAEKIRAAGGPAGSRTVALVSVFFLAGFGLKAALVPFHAWLPDAHPSAPAPISAMLSGLVIKALGVYPLVRIAFTVFGAGAGLGYTVMVLGVLSMVAGGLLAIRQSDYKRLLAYSSISQIGYVVLALGLAMTDGGATWAELAVIAGLFHLVNHAVFKSLLFLGAGAVEHSAGTRRLDEMGGLREKMPVTSFGALVGALSISGVPPFAGFFSKLLVIVACVQARRYGFAAWAAVMGIVTLGYFLRVQAAAFFGAVGEKVRGAREAPVLMGAAMVVLALACVGLSILVLPGLMDAVLGPAARALLDGEGYVKAAGLVLKP